MCQWLWQKINSEFFSWSPGMKYIDALNTIYDKTFRGELSRFSAQLRVIFYELWPYRSAIYVYKHATVKNNDFPLLNLKLFLFKRFIIYSTNAVFERIVFVNTTGCHLETMPLACVC